MRIPFVCANWKMYKTVDETVNEQRVGRGIDDGDTAVVPLVVQIRRCDGAVEVIERRL